MTTRTGRVIYDRPTHLFKYSDVQRIVRQVGPASAADIPDIVLTIVRAAEDLYKVGSEELLELGARGFWPAVPPGAALALLGVLAETAARAGELGLNFLRREGFRLLYKLLAVMGGPFFASDETQPAEPGEIEKGEEHG